MDERTHWLNITKDPEWKRNHIADPNISIDETLEAITSAFPKQLKSILEIGCGYGRLTVEIKKRYPAAFVAGVDINPDVLAEAERYSGYKDDPQYPTKYPFYYLTSGSLPERITDAIYSVAVFQHLPDTEKRNYIHQSGLALRKGGVVRIQFIEGTRDNFLDHWTSVDKMTRWMKDAGLKVLPVERGLAHKQWTWMTGVKP